MASCHHISVCTRYAAVLSPLFEVDDESEDGRSYHFTQFCTGVLTAQLTLNRVACRTTPLLDVLCQVLIGTIAWSSVTHVYH